MIRIQSFEAENIIPLLSGLVCGETTQSSYLLVNTILKLMPVDECVQEMYLIMTTLDRLYEIFSMANIVPEISRATLMAIINDNIYEEIKENKRAGFPEYARTNCQIELDFNNEETIATVCSTLLTNVEHIIEQAEELEYTLERSSAELIIFQNNYVHAITGEASRIIDMLRNSDYRDLRVHFWGWTYFLNRHKIYGIRNIDTFLNLIADTIRVKREWASMGDAPLNSLATAHTYRDRYIENSVPIFTTPFYDFDQLVKIVTEQITILVAPKGSGKTTWMGMIAGIALAKGKRVMFYVPEMANYKLLYECVLPPYIRAKYGFVVTPNQCLELEEPYEAGSEYSVAEKKLIIKMAIEDLVEAGNFYHITEYYRHQSLSSDMRAHVKSFNPDIIIFDHTQEILGDASFNEKTANLATTMKSIVKDFQIHALINSHPGSQFKTPTEDNPILVDVKIAAWSSMLEAVADNIMGAVKVGKDQFKIFFTKLRFATIPPMFVVFRMIKVHGWFEYRKEDQYVQSVDSNQAIQNLLEGVPLQIEENGYYDEDED